MSACQQCGGLTEVDVSHGRRTRRVPCRCLRDRVAALERELAELRQTLGTLAAQLPAKTGNNTPTPPTVTPAIHAAPSDCVGWAESPDADF